MELFQYPKSFGKSLMVQIHVFSKSNFDVMINNTISKLHLHFNTLVL